MATFEPVNAHGESQESRSRITRRSALALLGQGGIVAAVPVALTARQASASSLAECSECEEDQDCACLPPDPRIPQSTLADLSGVTAETTGDVRWLSDYDRGVWFEYPSQWVSLRGHVFDVRAFGANGDGQTDDWPAFHAAIEAMTSSESTGSDSTSADGHTLLVPPGTYRLAQSLVIDRDMLLTGAGGSGRFADARLLFDAGITGLIVDASNASVSGDPGRTGEGVVIRHLRLEGQPDAPAEAPPAHGVLMHARASLAGCWVHGFSGDGIRVERGPSSDATPASWRIERCDIASCGGHGLAALQGTGGLCSLLDVTENGQWGIFDDSQLGNTYVQCRAAGNVQGAFTTNGTDNLSLFLGCVAAAGQPRSVFAGNTLVVGGTQESDFEGGNAWTADASRVFLRAQSPLVGDETKPTAPTLRIEGAQGQAEPHLLVQNATDQRVAELTADGLVLIGPDAESGSPPSPALVQIGHPEPGRSGIRWAVPIEGGGYVAQVQAFISGITDNNPAGDRRLTFQTALQSGESADTLTLRDGRAGIGTIAPAGQAIVDMESTTQGFLPPRLTSEQRDAISDPPAGLQIFNVSTGRINVYDGAQWTDPGFFPPRLTSEERDAIQSPLEGTMIYNLTSAHLNVYDGDAWREVAYS